MAKRKPKDKKSKIEFAEEPKIQYTMELTEPKRKFIVEASRYLLKAWQNSDSYFCSQMMDGSQEVKKLACELLSWLPEVRYGSGNIGESFPFDTHPTHREPTTWFRSTAESLANFRGPLRSMLDEMKREESTDGNCYG